MQIEQVEKNMEKEVETIIKFRPDLSKSAADEPVLTNPESTEPVVGAVADKEPAVKESNDHN